MNWTTDKQAQLFALIHQRSQRDVLNQQLDHTEIELMKQETIMQREYAQLLKEEQDVDRLERLSWAKVYYGLLNRREEQLIKEQAEAEAALIRYDTLLAQVADLTTRRTQLQKELRIYENLDVTYDALIKQKTESLLAQDGKAGERYQLHLDALSAVDKHLHELKEAQTAGLNALNEVQKLVKLIIEAQNWGSWDVIGGSTLTSIIKYGKLDQVRDQSHLVSRSLQVFKAEFADVHQSMDIDWQFDNGLTRFADIFFDNIFTDLSVQNRIGRVRQEVRLLEDKLVDSLGRLKAEIKKIIVDHRNRMTELHSFLEQV